MRVDGLSVFDEDVGMVFGGVEFINRGFCSSLDDYDADLRVLRAWRNKVRVLREQRTSAGREFKAQTRLLNSFALI